MREKHLQEYMGDKMGKLAAISFSQVLSFAADSLVIKDSKPWQKYPLAGILIFFLPVTREWYLICEAPVLQ